MHTILGEIRSLFRLPSADTEDRDLLDKFLRYNDQRAFEVVIERYGPMVLGVCRRILLDPHDAEDAFQATFLVLVRKASSLKKRERLGNWLYGVACRTARTARRDIGRRRRRERQVHEMEKPDTTAQTDWSDLQPVLDAEIERLPDKYRIPFMLCYFEGQRHDEIAQQLGWPKGTVSGRLSRARQMLRDRLARRGVLVSAAGLAGFLQENAIAATPCALTQSTAEAASHLAIGNSAQISATVADLVHSVLTQLMYSRIKIAIAILLLFGAVGFGAVALFSRPGVRLNGKEQETAAVAKTDQFGDSLPPRVIARIGTIRFRNGGHGPVAYSQDGTLIASAMTRGVKIAIWNAHTGKHLRTFPGKPNASLRELAFAPDGKTIVSTHAWGPGKMLAWDVRTGEQRRPFVSPNGGVSGPIAFSPDGRFVASRTNTSDSILLWEVTRPDAPRRFVINHPKGRAKEISALAFSPDGKMLVSSGRNAARLWEVSTGKEIRCLKHKQWIYSIAVNASGKMLATGSNDNIIRTWKLATGEMLCRLKGHQDSVHSLQFTPSGDILVSAGHDRTIRVWDPNSGKQLRRIQAGKPGQVTLFVEKLVFSPDGTTLASSNNGALRFWNPITGKEIVKFGGHSLKVTCTAFNPNGQIAATGSSDGTVRLSCPDSGREIRCLAGHPAPVLTLAFSPDGTKLAAGGGTGSSKTTENFIFLWDVATGKKLRQFEGHRRGVLKVAFSADGKRLISGGRLGDVRIWELTSGKTTPVLEGLTEESPTDDLFVFSFDFSVDRRLLAIGLYVRGKVAVDVYETATKKKLRRFPLEHSSRISTRVVWSPDGNTLVGANSQNNVRMWNVKTGQTIGLASLAVEAMAFSPDGAWLALGCRDRSVRVLEVATGQELLKLSGHADSVDSVAFSPDSRKLVSGSTDSTALIWNLAPKGWTQSPNGATLTKKEFERLWRDLAKKDAGAAHRAIWSLAAAPQKSVGYLKHRLLPGKVADSAKIREFIQQLNSKRFAVREAATVELKKLGSVAELALRDALRRNPSLELRKRVLDILSAFEDSNGLQPSGEMLRRMRAVQILRRIGTDESREVLRKLSASS